MRILQCLFLLLIAIQHAYSADAVNGPRGAMWDLNALQYPPTVFPADGFKAKGVRALFLKGQSYKGKETRIFAYVGLPDVPVGTQVPGMVLVHGGGGTAFDQWVRRWTAHGYAAIAIDTCGGLPRRKIINGKSSKEWERHELSGPPGWGGFNQIDEPYTDQWAYHAVSAGILAHSYLLSLPEVDKNRTGLTGISWGGYLTCLIAPNDPRFKCAIPVYGCGFTNEHTFADRVIELGPERATRWMSWWDPSNYLANAKMPMCWVTGSNDFAYTFNALQKSYRLPPGPRTLAIRLRMPHGHGDAGEAPKEIFAFADTFLNGGEPLIKITGQGRDNKQVWATLSGKRNVVKAELNWTKDTGLWPKRKWESTSTTINKDENRITATLPEGTTVYYFNLFDDHDCVVSTEHEEVGN